MSKIEEDAGVAPCPNNGIPKPAGVAPPAKTPKLGTGLKPATAGMPKLKQPNQDTNNKMTTENEETIEPTGEAETKAEAPEAENTISDFIMAAIDKNALKAEAIFDVQIRDRITDYVQGFKDHIANNLLMDEEPTPEPTETEEELSTDKE